jgi:hypothetical protein|tara:strand:- start:6725 stop:6835 length:111 start_codon:yes stop_codon:yes gene_type:complete
MFIKGLIVFGIIGFIATSLGFRYIMNEFGKTLEQIR